MARIPTPSTRRELPAGPNQMPGVRLSAAPSADQLFAQREPANAPVTRNIVSATGALADTLRIIEARDDQTQVMAAEAEAKKALVDLESSWTGRTLTNAKGLTKDTETWLAENREKFRGQLHNARQRRAFDESWSRLGLTARNAASRHEAVETHRANGQALEASIVGTIEVAAMNAGDPDEIRDARAQIEVRIGEMTRNLGMDPTTSALEKLKYTSAFHEKVIGSLMQSGDPARVEQYLKDNAGDMNESTRARVAKTVETHVSIRRAQTFADEMMSAGRTEAEAIREAREKLEGEDEVRAVSEIQTRHAELNGARERAQRAAADEAWGVYGRTGNPNSIPAGVWARMDGKDIAAIRRDHEQRLATAESRAASAENRAWTRLQRIAAEAERKLAEQRTDLYEGQRQRLLTATPEEAAAIDLHRLTGDISPTQMSSLIELQQRVAKPGKPEDPARLDAISLERQLSDTITDEKFGKREASQLRQDIGRIVNEEQIRLGKKLSQGERQRIIDARTATVRLDQTGWDPERRVLQVTPDDRPYVPGVKDVPLDQNVRITRKLIERGIEPTPDAVRRYHGLLQGAPQ